MADKRCPKCNLKIDDPVTCAGCGVIFNEYETQKNEKLGEVYHLLNENKFEDARRIAEELPLKFPDNKSDFLLLLSNINRDINIIEKCDQALKNCEDGDYSRASFLLRNIKAFDKKLDEKVISLRRKIERFARSSVNFSEAVDAINRGDYGHAINLLGKVSDARYQDDVNRYLKKIEDIKNELLNDVINSIKKNQLKAAESKLDILRAAFPGIEADIEGFFTLVSQKIEIKNKIFKAANKALKEKRYLESKIICFFLGMQFPDTLARIQPLMSEIGDKAIISLADMHNYGVVDVTAQGLEIDDDGLNGLMAVAEGRFADTVTGCVSEANGDGTANIVAVKNSPDAVVDTVRKQVDFGGVIVADFIF